MQTSQMLIDEELSMVQAQLTSNQIIMEKEIKRAIHRLGKQINDLEVQIRILNSRLSRKEAVIKRLQASLKSVFNRKKLLEDKLKHVDLAEISETKIEMDKLRGEIKHLRKKNKIKAGKIMEYELLLQDVAPEEFEEDPDEEDGSPSEDSSGAEDIDMIDTEVLLNDEQSTSTDPNDSDFELDEKDKAKMEKDMKKRDKTAKKAKMKKEERAISDETKKEEEELAKRDGTNDEAGRDETKEQEEELAKRDGTNGGAGRDDENGAV